MEKESILYFKDVSMFFGGVKAIDSLSLTVQKGELIGIIGPNGAGKTTILNVLTGVYIPTKGEIIYRDCVLNKIPPNKIVSQGIARTFQNIRLFSEMSVVDNVKVAFFGRTSYNIFDIFMNGKRKSEEEKAIDDEAMDLLMIVGLADKAKSKASSLAYGEQRKLEIARALACKPEILLLDEPAAGMNPNEIDELNKTILSLKERFDLTIILIEHQMRLVMGICERIIVMNFGKCLAIGTPQEIRNNIEVLEAYLGKAVKNVKY